MSRLAEHASIPIAFLVERIFEISRPGKGVAGTDLTEVAVERPWEKDYDAIAGGSPTCWLTRFDTTNWGLIAAYDGADRVGGAVIAFNTPGVNMLEGQAATAVLWDLRVRPNVRRSGVGTMLFNAVEDWARQERAGRCGLRRRASTCRRAGSTHEWVAASARSTSSPIRACPTRYS